MLMGHALVRPTGRPVAVGPLEADEEPVLAGEPGEIVAGLGVELEAGGLLVERGQRHGVRAVERDRGVPYPGRSFALVLPVLIRSARVRSGASGRGDACVFPRSRRARETSRC